MGTLTKPTLLCLEEEELLRLTEENIKQQKEAQEAKNMKISEHKNNDKG